MNWPWWLSGALTVAILVVGTTIGITIQYVLINWRDRCKAVAEFDAAIAPMIQAGETLPPPRYGTRPPVLPMLTRRYWASSSKA